MGLLEQLRAGGELTRTTKTFPVAAFGQVELGSAYIILSVQSNKPCRLRLYDTEESIFITEEVSREFGDTDISSSVSLVGDFYITASGRQYIDPALYAVSADINNPVTYYRADVLSDESFANVSDTRANITLTSFSIEDEELIPQAGTPYVLSNRRTLEFIEADIPAESKIQGTLEDTPKTFLLVSASLDGGEHARLRLYSIEDDIYNTDELNRRFDQAVTSSISLISDVILSGSNNTIYFSPKTMGANLNTMGGNLLLARERQIPTNDEPAISGKSEIYYILENLNSSQSTISVSLHVYSLED
jgi:hypothetical protein